MVAALSNASFLSWFVLGMAPMVDIVRQKARFVCFPFVFVGGLVSCFHSLHLRETFYKISWVASF